MDSWLFSLLSGFALAAVIALVAWRARSLSRSGALGAVALGTVIFGLGGLGWAILLLGFFISSSLLSRLFKGRKARFDEKFSKGSQRDAAQVFANGGTAGLFALLHFLFPDSSAALFWAAFAGALAAANADTWATELGVLSRANPRLITNGRAVEPGTSGGISLLGVLSALCGALLIALLAVIFWQGRVSALYMDSPAWLARLLGSQSEILPLSQAVLWTAWISVAGLFGSLLDSLLGATIQAIYYCQSCQKETERHPLHTCGTPTVLQRGLVWLGNDGVNLLCTLCGGVMALLMAL